MTSSMLVLLCVGWFALAAAWSVHAPAPYDLEDAELHFEQFIKDFGRNYADENEKQLRFQIFKGNLEKINKMNEKSKHAVYGVTQFSDISQEEFKYKFGCLGKFEKDIKCTFAQDSDIKYNDAPDSWDWREHGAVTPVKDQKRCGSCYAFSAIANIESQYAIKNKKQVTLSEQQVVDCDKENGGCEGGFMSTVMKSLISEGGSESDADYPYKGVQDDTCHFDAKKVKVQLSDCRSYNLTSQEKLKQVLYNNGPLAIAINADALNGYHGGIVDDDLCADMIDHGVLLVGYGSEDNVPYWIVKNSWGTVFGENGYFRMHRGENYHSCGMMNDYMASAIVA